MKARFDGNSELVAELVTVNGFKPAYAIKDGAEGPRGWLVFANPSLPCTLCVIFLKLSENCVPYCCQLKFVQKSGLPWTAPKKSLIFDLSNLTGALGVCTLVIRICLLCIILSFSSYR